jgi:hypothetical protein
MNSLVGNRFGRLSVVAQAPSVVVARVPRIKYRRAWECVCDCGARVVVNGNRLNTGITKSCGCLKRDVARAMSTTHGHSTVGGNSPTYETWRGMIDRCTNQGHVSFSRYGGRGIVVCERWRTFANFLVDMGERPAGKTLDRRNNDLGYSVENCRWATNQEQGQNTRTTKLNADKVQEIRGRYEHGEFQSSIAKRFGITQSCVSAVILGRTWA